MKNISLTKEASLHLAEWMKTDPQVMEKIISLLAEIAKSPFEGSGKPVPLKDQLKGKWSRRINQAHPIVYEVKDENVIILSCRYQY